MSKQIGIDIIRIIRVVSERKKIWEKGMSEETIAINRRIAMAMDEFADELVTEYFFSIMEND